MNWYFTIVGLCATILVVQSQDNGKVIFCYFQSWSVYRSTNGSFDIDDIDPNLCTHVMFSFLGINDNGSLRIIDNWESDKSGLDGFRRIVALKQQNPNLQVLVSVGGWNEGSKKFSHVAADANKRAVFIKEIVAFIEEFGFDGLDFVWMYPARIDSSLLDDRENFVLILEKLKEVLKPNGHILTTAINGGKRNMDISYNIPAISDIVDYMNVISYDFHGSFDNYVGHLAPLLGAEVDGSHNNSEWNINDGFQYLFELGANPAKLTLGIATYGRTFTLADRAQRLIYANITGGGKPGPLTNMPGVLGYNEICLYYSHVTDTWDVEQLVPHKYTGDQWIGYENQVSVTTKVKYALSQELGGLSVWSLDTDDFKGLCGYGKYPLITTISGTLTKNGYKLKSKY